MKHFYCSNHLTVFCRECIRLHHSDDACFVVDLYEIQRMRKLQKDMKTLRDNKKTLTDALVNVMKSNEIDVFDINDGKLVYAKTKVKVPINKTNLFAALMQHYNDEGAAKKLSEFIMDSRQEKVKESIRRKIQK